MRLAFAWLWVRRNCKHPGSGPNDHCSNSNINGEDDVAWLYVLILLPLLLPFWPLLWLLLLFLFLLLLLLSFNRAGPGNSDIDVRFSRPELLPPENVFDCCPNHIGIDSPHRLIGFIKILAHLLRCVLGFIELCLL